MGFDVRKAAQVVAFFTREAGGKESLIKIVKMVYLADRLFLERHEVPLLNDDLCSMEHGPVNSRTYDFIKRREEKRDVWNKYIQPRKGDWVRLTRPLDDDDLDELSRADWKVLGEINKKFKDYEPFDLVEYVHRHCSEWENVGKTSRYLPYERVFNAIGKKNSNALADRVREYIDIGEAYKRAR